MKNISFYSLVEWFRLEPIFAFLKQLRNDLLLLFYRRLKAVREDSFLFEMKRYQDKCLLIVIAFEQPKVLEWLFRLSEKNLNGVQLIVFDNSRKKGVRREIGELCNKFQVPYLELPYLRCKHPNRSHGLAMSWVFHRIIKRIKPKYFGYLDHDMFPIKSFDQMSLIPTGQKIYGLLNDADFYWNLWAGYCFFDFEFVKNKNLNFLYDFSRGVDTGGRNWPHLYKNEKKSAIKFARIDHELISINPASSAVAQLIDDAWIHVGGVSYNNNLESKEIFYQQVVDMLCEGKSLAELKIITSPESNFNKIK